LRRGVARVSPEPRYLGTWLALEAGSSGHVLCRIAAPAFRSSPTDLAGFPTQNCVFTQPLPERPLVSWAQTQSLKFSFIVLADPAFGSTDHPLDCKEGAA